MENKLHRSFSVWTGGWGAMVRILGTFPGRRSIGSTARPSSPWQGVIFLFFGLKRGFLGKFAHRGAQAARILKPLKNGRAHFKAGFWTCGGVGAHF